MNAHIWQAVASKGVDLEGAVFAVLSDEAPHPGELQVQSKCVCVRERENPTPYTPHSAPYTLHPTPYNLHSAPYTLHPTPYTLHPTPYTLHPTPYTE